MERNIQKNGLINFLILLVIGAASLAASKYSGSLAGQAASFFIALGVLAAAVSWFQMRLEEQEKLEKLEFDEVTKANTGANLFNTGEAETFPARRSREQFEKIFVPGFTIALFLLEGAGAWYLWRWLQKQIPAIDLGKSLVTMGLLALFALVLFILGKYSAGMSRLQNQRLLRPSASYLLLGAYALGAVAVGLIFLQGNIPVVDVYLADALVVLLGLLALETGISLLLEIYRPKVQGKVGLLLYESRVIGLLSHPEGLFTTAAHALDYQFGFKVSETWFYQFLAKYLRWIVVGQLALLVLSTSFVFIGAGEQALLERFGRPVSGNDLLASGFHLKFPWPIDRVYRYRTDEIQSFYVGFVHGDKDEDEQTVLWTVKHYKEEFQLLVASRDQVDTVPANATQGKKSPPVNLLSVGIPVQYQIHDLRAWAYNHQNAGDLLEKIGTREVVRYLVSIDVQEIMSTGRFQAGEELRNRIQTRADELKLGAKILFVGLQDVHPPTKVAASYEKVVGAYQTRNADILAAQAYAVRTNALAAADAVKLKRVA
ncbi:MAG TPA: SPFH domain-containing protein, partial [Candidatus Saccharimonadales bacterium]|nr:SPFH domain-containing protein [Candidatus Saccharimonadales bacterium]